MKIKVVFSLRHFKLDKSKITAKIPRLVFSELKMQTVFSSKNKGFSCLYD